jgi:hypothetical protein
MNSSALRRRLSFPLRCLVLAAVLSVACASAFGQADYTSDLPSVDRVKAEIKGRDPTDSLARQVAVFTYLQSYIERIKYNRTVRGPYTPGEEKARAAYSLAAYQISQDYAKSHPPAEAAAFERLHGQYELDSAFYDDWSKRLIGPQTVAAYKDAEAGLAASSRRFEAQIQQDLNPTPSGGGVNAQGLSNDLTAAATRRCLELGGESLACVGTGFTSGIIDAFTARAGLGELAGPGRVGPFLSGNYGKPSATGLGFEDGMVTLLKCGTLADDLYPYTLNKSNSLQVTVATKPKPILLTMRADGSLTGPGPVTIDGRIITGYHVETYRAYKDGVPATDCGNNCVTTTRTPIYSPKTDRCTVAALDAPSPPPASAAAQDSSLLGGLMSFMGTIAPGSLPGIRMTGKYSFSGLLVDFAGDAVTLDCGQAHVKAPYTVENGPSQFLVHVQNSGGPFTVAVASDNTLRGSGSTTINGRLVTGMTGDKVTFAPHSESCNLGTLSPAAGSAAIATTVARVPTSPAPATPAPAPTAAASVTVASADSASPIKLAITTSFPGGANVLAGHPVMLMTDRFDNALRNSGGPIPADITPGKALQAYAANCLAPKSCPSITPALNKYYVGRAMFDSTGKVTMDAAIPPGTYYVFSSANSGNDVLVWDLPIEIKATGNVITLQTSNAEVMR